MKYLFEKGTKIVLLKSENLNAERCLVKLRNYYDVLCMVAPYYKNSKAEYRNYKGVSTISFYSFFNAKRPKNVKFIIFENDNLKLPHLIELLKQSGLKYLDDYVWWENLIKPYYLQFFMEKNRFEDDFLMSYHKISKYFSRKIAIVVGNCQIAMIKKYLLANRIFRELYCLVDFPEICNYSEGLFEEKIIGASDLIITQIISDDNRHNKFLSTNSIRKYKSDNSRIVTISSLAFTGYFPQHTSECDSDVLGHKLVVYGDKNINAMFAEGKTNDEITQALSSNCYYDASYLDTFFTSQLEMFKSKDMAADVKMWDYLFNNSRNEILFHSFNHPKSKVIREQTSRILAYIGILDTTFESEEIINTYNKMFTQEEAIYPCVYAYLGLPYDGHRIIHPNLWAAGFDFTFSEYIDYYINAIDHKDINIFRNKSKVKVAIWGSCISREILNYTENIELTAYMLQNPIHTFLSDPFLCKDELLGTSNFTAKCLKNECNKSVFDILKKNPADYLLIDTCDCRNDYWQKIDNPNCKISQSLSADMNFGKGGKYENLFQLKSVFEISDEEWKGYVDSFCERVLSLYDNNHIILVQFNFAEYYIKDGEKLHFDNWELYKQYNRITDFVADLIKSKIPNIRCISAEPCPIGNYYHHIGNSNMHYVEDIYIRQARELENLIGC